MRLKKIIKNPWFISFSVALLFFILGIFLYKENVETQGNYSPGIVKGNYQAGDSIAGDKITNYYTVIEKEIAKTNKSNIATEKTIRIFFQKLQLSLKKKRTLISKDELTKLPGYLQRSYDMNITISESHGIGYEFITPSEAPQINISTTNMPIEEYYFSKYTNKTDFSKAIAMRIANKYIVLANLRFIAGKKVILVTQEANTLLKNIGIQYSREDTTKEIEVLRLFGNNQEDFWKQIDPVDEATFLFNAK